MRHRAVVSLADDDPAEQHDHETESDPATERRTRSTPEDRDEQQHKHGHPGQCVPAPGKRQASGGSAADQC